jgi:dihydrofolate synthase / folylpolyglutamate synthase
LAIYPSKKAKYLDTIAYLFNKLPVYQRIGSAAYRADLSTTIALDKMSGHPHRFYPSIHIAGTNGKGSVSHIMASVLQACGLKTGLYTSPHLVDFRERIKINGKKIPESDVVRFVEKYRGHFEKLKPSFFEITFAMAVQYFYDEQVDIAVIETGLGGRLDSTNIIQPLVSAITNVSLDHTVFLGDTTEKIAREKAGIIKKQTPVVIGETAKETKPVFMEFAKENEANIVFADDVFTYKKLDSEAPVQSLQIKKGAEIVYESLKTDLSGDFQARNIITALAVIDELNKQQYNITKRHIQKGFSNVSGSTGFIGRWQVIGKKPLIVCDVVHNREGIAQVVRQLQATQYKTLHIVFGIVKERNPDTILELLPENAIYYFTKANIPRALDEDTLYLHAQQHGLKGSCFSTVEDAYGAAKQAANKQDVIFIGGSNFVVAEILAKKDKR